MRTRCQKIFSLLFVGAVAYSGGYFGEGVGSIGNFLCSNESGLLQCPYSTVTCSSTKAAGVRCRGKITGVSTHAVFTTTTYRYY